MQQANDSTALDGEASAPATPPRLLFVDDEPGILNAMKRVFRGLGYDIFTAGSGAEALALLENQPVDLIISDMRMPEMDGAQFLEKVFSRWPEIKRILLTGYSDASATIAAINQAKIWRYISKPWDDAELLLCVEQALAHRQLLRENADMAKRIRQQNEELKALNTSLEHKVTERTAELRKANVDLHHSFLATVQVFSNLIELREGKLAGHSRRVADFGRQLAERMGLEESEQRVVLLAGLLHDIGKVGLPDKLLERPFNALTPLDKAEVMRHPEKGQQLLMGVPQLVEPALIIRHHHECMDGSGFPDQLGGLLIPLGARILAVANDYDALQMGSLALHPHKPSEAREAIIKQRGKRYDPTVVDAFAALLAEAEPKQEIEKVVPVPELKPGMMLTRDLLHNEGYLLLPKGRVLDVGMIAQLRQLQETDSKTIQVHIRRGSGAATLRDAQPAAPPRMWKEVGLKCAQLKEGMRLSRSLHHHNGYLLLARGNQLTDAIIRQLRDIEVVDGQALTIHIHVDAK